MPQTRQMCRRSLETSSEEAKRRQSCPVSRVHVKRRNQFLDRVLNGQIEKRRVSYPVHDGRSHDANRKRCAVGSDLDDASLKRRKSSLLRYHKTLSSRRKGLEGFTVPANTSIITVRGNSPLAAPGRRTTGGNTQTQQPGRHRSVTYVTDAGNWFRLDNKDDDPKDLTYVPSPPRRRSSAEKALRRREQKRQTRKKRTEKEKVFTPITCDYCEAAFKEINEAQRHLAEAHADDYSKMRARCPYCDFRFVSVKDLGKHEIAAHKNRKKNDGTDGPIMLPCFVCFKEVAKTLLRQHIMCKHPEAFNDDLRLDQMEKKYCPLCKKLICSGGEDDKERTLRGHIRVHHKDRFSREATVNEMLYPGKKKQESRWTHCEVCKKRYGKDQLKKHMEIKHPSYEAA